MFIALALGRETKYHTANFYALSNFIMRHVYPYNWPFWNVTLAAEKTEINMVKLTSQISLEEQLRRFNQQFEFLEPFECPLCAPVSRGFGKFPLPTSPKELQFDAYAELFLIVYDLFSAIKELVIKRSVECPYCKFVLRLLTPAVQETLHNFRLDPRFFVANAEKVPVLFHDWCKEIKDSSVALIIKTGVR
jgi:glutaredoxin